MAKSRCFPLFAHTTFYVQQLSLDRPHAYCFCCKHDLECSSLSVVSSYLSTPKTKRASRLPETYAFLQIFEKKTEAEVKEDQERDEPIYIDGTEKVFSGWMLASKPAMSASDHGVYDVWVIGCVTPEIKLPDFEQ